MIDVTALKTLQAVEVHGSVVGAAEALGYSPSAVSQQVKKLEKQAGVDLLERLGRGVVLTELGRSLVDQGAQVLADLERLESDLHARSGEVIGSLRVAAFSTAIRGLLAPVAGALGAQYPRLTLRLHEVEPWEAAGQVGAGLADLGIVHRWGEVPIAIPEHVESLSIARDIAEVIVRDEHPLAGREFVTVRDLVDENWIATPENTICRQWLGRMYDGTGRLPRIAHQAMEFDSHLAMVSAGLGIALIPRLGREALPANTVALRVRDPEPTREILVLWRRSRASSPAVRAVVEALDAAG